MYNLRYHIASLVSVFLALAIGLVLGGLVVGQGTIDRQEAALIDGLRKEFATLRTENQELSATNETLASFAGMQTDGWVAGRLEDRAVAVVSTSGRSEGLEEAADAVESAGGTVVSVTVPVEGLDLGGPDVGSVVASFTGDPEVSLDRTAGLLAAEWTQASAFRPLTEALVEAGLLEVEGLSDDTVVGGVVVLAAPDGKPDESALAIGRALAEADVSALGAELLEADTGVASAAASVGLSALDTLGTHIGRYTLVALLTGAKPGYYGEGEGASAPFPPLPTP